MATKYIQSYYDGSLFEYSKDQKEGFLDHKNSKDVVSYRKYYNKGVEGVLLNVNRKKNQNLNNREELEIVLQDGEDKYQITFPVLNNNGDEVDDFMESIIRVMPALEKGQKYNVNNWKMNRGDVVNGEVVNYGSSGVTFKTDGEKVQPVLTYKTDKNPDGDIPKVEWKEKAGKNRPTAVSKEKKLDYLYEVFERETERLGYSSSGSNSTPSEKTTSQNPTEKAKANENPFAPDDEYDSLPF